MIAEGGDELTAVRALRLGALDYLPKRLLTPQRLNAAVRLDTATHRAARGAQPRTARARRGRLGWQSSGSAAVDRPAAHRHGAARSHSGLSDPARPSASPRRPSVYLATSLELKRDIALKVSKIVDEGADEPQVLARERAALGAIRHPAIVEIHDYGWHAGS